jgi:uncharacterized protein YbjT (DUF2867 family)
MILVAGGTGTLGTRVVRLLIDRGQTVRVLTRDPSRAAHLPDTVQALTGDLRDPAAVATAVPGCATVVSAVHGLVGHDQSLRGQLLEVAGPENLTFTQLAERLIIASGKPGRTRHVPLLMLRAMSVLARPVSPVFARQAQATVVMNTTDMTVDVAAIRSRFPAIPATTLDQVIRRQPPPEVPGARADAPGRSGKQAPSASSQPPASPTG